MTVQLPHDLAVSDARRVERVESAPVHAGRPAARDRVEVPVNGVAKRQSPVPEKIEVSLTNRVGDRHGLVAVRRHILGDQARRLRVRGALEEPRGAGAPKLLEQGGRFTGRARSSSGHTDSLEPLRGFLPAAAGQFGDSHVHHAQELHATRPA